MKRFLDVAYVFLVERFQAIRPNMTLEEALEMAEGYEAGAKNPPKPPDEAVTAGGIEDDEAAQLRQEEEAMAEFERAMAATRG